MGRIPRVLVGIVTYEGKDYVWDKFFHSMKAIDYPNVDFLVVDNSESKSYSFKLKKRTARLKNWEIVHVKRGMTSRESQAKSLNIIRERVLTGGYDYFMSVESDLLPPADIIERLMLHRVPIVGCIYTIGFTYSDKQPPRFCLFSKRKNPDGTWGTENLSPEVGYGYFGNGLVKVHGCGLGCTLIHRSVLEKVRFWYILDAKTDVNMYNGELLKYHPYMVDKSPKHSDVLLYTDLDKLKIDVYVDSNIVIPHWNSDWKDVKDI